MPGRDTRTRLIDAAMELFYLNGYEATSVAEILERAGAGSGSLYYYFKDKEDLAYAVAEQYLELLFPVLFAQIYEEVEDPIERIFAVLANYRKALTDTEFTYGCPIGRLALEVGASLPRVGEKLAENFDGWIEQMRILFDLSADRFPPNTDFHALATLVLTTMEGGVMLSRTKKSIEPFDTAIAQLRRIIDALLAAQK